ncbi:DUF4190 domain-containing protein [Parageobacillus sp. VR-IP]|jgi:hypothetical protein|uniref:DUF4190 domain-containing protein n=2 Tax=Saccharococcus caldoxylosilyticus TaxID=81408 RepID=A0A023D9Q9_9BACL|nr:MULTISPECIES: hypothetical protein [Parageobacillus]OQP03793.1 hypothetical protein BSK33_05045 [Geobacillus sp. 44B]KYD12366.1 hypothetical protein B4119_2872 [Parageobacillus caldoxylosilyticus]MBB3851024.1 hypothetical protein [Parageobacillus caldoxylosilyticus]NUK30917.1 DUF4190 domain-containing protein [Parageobacillus sp. VR-IP]QNU36425.1 DUF4190 domain-containing protein [Geobacillus sp. 44B]
MVDDRERTYNESYVQSIGKDEPERDFMEETAAEIAEPVRRNDERGEEEADGAGLGWLALALSIISLFIWPVLLGAAGIIVGFIARRRGAETLGAWAIGIGIVAIIVRLFIMPFYS